ncbi:MAG: zinc-binding dehydrogenase [Armatimonadota bacterium]|nr:zinc-binding dehydrogenase [Armatimonadota bacterium]
MRRVHPPCRNGYPNQCLNLEEIGFTIPGALCEPTSVAWNAMFTRAGGFRPGGYVAVFGTGPIGFAAIALARAAGAGKIIAFEVSPIRQELARRMGADEVYNPVELAKQGTAPRAVILESTKGEGVDLHVEAAGAPARTTPEMEATLAIGGRIVMIGKASERTPIYLEHFQTHAAQIYGAQGHSGYGNFPYVIRLMAAGKVDMTQIITSRFPLDRAVEAVQKATRREDGKIMVRP